jgi:FixJ family two-component response regulator
MLDILKKEKIHCVVCDISMPGMNGLEVIKAAREIGYDKPFAFYTAHGNEKLMREVVKYNAFDFLDKPNLDGLQEVVTKGLQKGLNGQSQDSDDQGFMSDFHTLLKRLEKE